MTEALSGSDGLPTIAGLFAELSQAMAASAGGGVSASLVVRFAAESVPGCAHAALTILDGRRAPRTTDATGPVPQRVDAIQYAIGQGPCLDAATSSDIARVDDLRVDRQWPLFAARAVAETAVRSMFSVRLMVTDTRRAALNFYAEQPYAFTEESIATGTIFGSFASLILINQAGQETVANLENAVASNRRIGIAVGILMARNLLTAEQAFDQLRLASQSLHVKLRDIAEAVTVAGDLPEIGRGRSSD